MEHKTGGRRATGPSAGPYIADWTKISPGEGLEVCLRGGAIASGPADGVTRDGSMVWILQEYPEGRAIFHKRDGISLRRAATSDSRPDGPRPSTA